MTHKDYAESMLKVLSVLNTAASILLLALVIFRTATADDVVFEAPLSFKGTGCPGEVSVAVVGAGTPTLSVLFGRFDSGESSVSGLFRTACSFAIPVKVIRGFQVSHITVDWEGYVEGEGELKRKLFLAGHDWIPWQINSFNEPDGENFTIRDNLLHASFAVGCDGAEYNLRINSQIIASEASYIAVDSADLNNKVTFKIKFEEC